MTFPGDKKWEILSEQLHMNLYGHYHPLVEKTLWSRGITDPSEIDEFMAERPQCTHDPFLMKGMEEAVTRIEKALEEHQKIVFYGDYDVDGITSVALLLDFFFPLTKQLEFYIPLRDEEGYGLNREALLEISEVYQADLVVTADCGTNALDECAFAREIGLELLITDHHTPGNLLPEAVILNPKQPDCSYPFKELSGCGVAFKLIQALQQRLQLPKKSLHSSLDLVALATVCDVVPLVDENRTLVKYGLERIRSRQRIGLQALMSHLSLEPEKVGAGEIGFILGPHFNASGRIDDARSGVRLLVTKDPDTAKITAAQLHRMNEERRTIQEQGLEMCMELVETQHQHDPFLVVAHPGLHEGVIGIIAGRLRDLYYRPTIVLTESSHSGHYTGSGRSIDGFSLFEELRDLSHLLERFGGHDRACGLMVKEAHIPEFRRLLSGKVTRMKRKKPDLLVPSITVVDEVDTSELSEEAIHQLERLAPYGMGNEKPYFLLKNLSTDQRSLVQLMGKNQEHLKVKTFLQHQYQRVENIEMIGFGMEQEQKRLVRSHQSFDLVFYPQVNEFRGKKNIQLVVKDLKEADTHERHQKMNDQTKGETIS